MSDIVSLVIDVGVRIKNKVDEIRSINSECRKLADIVSKLQPIFLDLDTQLRKAEHRQIMETLLNALITAEDVVEYIREHPRYTSFWSGTYKGKLEDAIQDIDSWILRIQPLTSGETFRKLGIIKTDIATMSSELRNKLDSISGKLDDLPGKVLQQIRNELSPLLHQQGKNPRFQQFIDEEERRNLTMLETRIAKNDGALDSFFCSITGDIMEDPYMCVASGNSYEKEAIRKHIGICYQNGEKPYDPLTRAIIKDPVEGIVPNRGLQNAIQEWKRVSCEPNVGSDTLRVALEEERRKHNEDAERIQVFEKERKDREKMLKDEQRKRRSYDKKIAIQEKTLEGERKTREKLEAQLKTYDNQIVMRTANDNQIVMRTDTDIREAVNLWCSDRANAERIYGPISKWDVSNVTNMEELFRDKKEFNDDISGWDVSKVTGMRDMFRGTSSFNQPLNDWDVSKVTEMYGMFYGASFNQPLNDWNVSNVTNMESMFGGASSFNQPLNDWNVSNVTNMVCMFCGPSFNQPLNDWNVSNVTNMKYMFDGASSFNQPLNNWNVSNVTNMVCMFNYASSFNQPLNDWDVSMVALEGSWNMFDGCPISSSNEPPFDLMQKVCSSKAYAPFNLLSIITWMISVISLLSKYSSTALAFVCVSSFYFAFLYTLPQRYEYIKGRESCFGKKPEISYNRV